MSDVSTPKPIITRATTEDLDDIRRLFVEYAEWLNVDLTFQGFQEELKTLPGIYGPPRGDILIATSEGIPAGCVAVKSMEHVRPGACEMKRLWVRPEYQRMGIGRRLVTQLISAASALGYREMILDTLSRMTGAVQLYHSLGFTETAPYYHNPIPGALYFSRTLGESNRR